ncbi:hypothetical protein Tco_0158342 [Tanacetum coccineum]
MEKLNNSFLGLQVQQKKDGIFISQDKYVGEILKKFRFTEVKTASTPMETQKTLLKDEDGEEVHVHMYRSMIVLDVSYIFKILDIYLYLKGQLKLGLWYPKDSPFDLVAYTDSDYARASLDRKSVVVTSLIHIESRKSPTAVLFDDDTGRISIRHCCILKSITLNVMAISQLILVWTLDNCL